MLLRYYFPARKASVPASGLTPVWAWLRRLDTGEDIRPQPAILPLGPGIYRFDYDAEASGEAVGQIDLGATISDGYERWQDVAMTRENGRILTPQAGVISFAAG